MTEKFLKLDTSDDAWKALLLPVFGLTFVVWLVVKLLIIGLPVLVIVMVAGIQEGAILSLFAIAASFFCRPPQLNGRFLAANE